MQPNEKVNYIASVDDDVIDIDALPQPSKVTSLPSAGSTSGSANENEIISVDSPVSRRKPPTNPIPNKPVSPIRKQGHPEVIEISPSKVSTTRKRLAPEISEVKPASTSARPRVRRKTRPDLSEITPITQTPIAGPSRPPPRSTPGSFLQPPGSSSRRITNRGDLEEDELMNPSVSVIDLFRYYNKQHFWGSLNGVFVEFSKRMTSCAGTCTFKGRLGGCRIALSEPLLKFRPRSDLLSTLLHEMIHAYLFMTEGIQRDGFDGHGPKFLSHAARINAAERGRVSITPYHTFHDEVELYRVHHWTCQKCGKLVKRAMNRAPSRHDTWWPVHAARCGGAFVKTKEPPPKAKKPKKEKKVKAEPVGKGNRKIEDMLKKVKKEEDSKAVAEEAKNQSVVKVEKSQSEEVVVFNKAKMVECPVCGKLFEERLMNEHLDRCLNATPPAVETPLSGQLYKERHFGIDKSELQTPTRLTSTRRESSIDLITFGIQRMFGGDDALLDFVILGKPLPGNRIRPSGIIYELATSSDAPPIKPFAAELTPAEIQFDAKRRLDVADDPHVKQKSLLTTPTRQSKLIETTNSFIRNDDHLHSYTPNRMNLVRGTPKRKASDISSDTKEILVVGSPGKNPAQPKASSRTPWWKTRPSENSDMTIAKPKAKRVRKENPPTAPRLGPTHRSIYAPSPMQPCPMCGKSVMRSKLNSHVNACLDASGLEKEFEQSEAEASNSQPPQQKFPIAQPRMAQNPFQASNYGRGQPAVHMQELRRPQAPPPHRRNPTHTVLHSKRKFSEQRAPLQPEVQQRSMVPCPICNTPTPRSQLDRHTSACLAASGLDFS